MDIKYFFKLIKLNLHWIFIIPTLMVVISYFITTKQKDEFKSNTLVYTGIATGYNINIESTDNTRSDYLSINASFDNLINIIESQQAKEEVGIRLLADDIINDRVNIEDQPDIDSTDINRLIEKLNYQDEEYNLEITQRSFIRTDEQDQSNIAKIYKFLHAEYRDSTLVHLIFNSTISPYSVKNISRNLAVKRKGNSDMIEMSYTSKNPKTAQKTLETLLDVFTTKQAQLKENEALNVVKYFENELGVVSEKLKTSESALKKFKEDNGVINYTSQTDFVATQRETAQAEHDKELMTLRGAQKARARLEEELKKKTNMPQFNAKLVQKQKQLSTLNDRKVRYELRDINDSVRAIQSRINIIENEMRDALALQYVNSQSTSGVTADDILQNWLQKTIEEAESEARLKVFKLRIASSNREYNKYAPLGSKLNQLNRQVDIAEKEYLQSLTNLNQSKIRQNNIAMASSVDIVDYPTRPTEPEKDKKMLLIGLAGTIGLLSILGLIVIVAYFNDDIRSPQRANKKTGIEVIGALPFFKKRKKYKKATEKLVDQIISKINILNRKRLKANYKQTNIMIYSVLPREGKSTVIEYLEKRLNETNNNNISFYEHPSLVNGDLQLDKIENKSHIQIVVLDANRPLDDADLYHLDRLSSVTSEQYIILNKVKNYILDSVLGKIPKV